MNNGTKTQKRRFIVVEANKTSAEHATFNRAVLDALHSAAIASDTEILWICDPSHRQAIVSTGDPRLADIEWKQISVRCGLTRDFIRKFTSELRFTISALLNARRQRASLVFLSVFPNVLPFILLFRRLFRDVPVHIFLHGELESLVIPEKQAFHREGFWVKLALLHVYKGDWPHFYVLGNGIRDRLIGRFPEFPTLQHVASVEHPYNFNCPVYKFPLRTQKTIRVGFIGVGRRAKGIIAFFQLARSFSHWISAGELEFILVGGLESRLIANSAEDHRVTILAENGAGLAPHQYREAISELDCALFLSSQNYSLTASGSVFDALNAGIEILSLKSDYLADIAKYDPEGGIKLFDSLSEIELELKRRLAHGWPRRKFEYSQLKIRHAKESMNLLSVRLTS